MMTITNRPAHLCLLRLAALVAILFWALSTASAANLPDTSQPELSDSRFPQLAKAIAEMPDSRYLTVSELARRLDAVAHNDEQRAYAIFRWITTHIRYDAAKLRRGTYRNLTAAEVMAQRQAVCGGFSALFQALAAELRLRSKRVIGRAKGYGMDTLSHAWNAVRINNRWQLMDATWGAGYLNDRQRFVRQHNDYFFMTPPGELIYSHFPDDENWQLLRRPVSLAWFRQSAHLYPGFFNLELSLRTITTTADGTGLAMTLRNPGHAKLAARIISGKREVQGNWFLSHSDGDNSTIEIRFPGRGDYLLELFGQKAGGSQTYHTILTRQMHARSRAHPYPKLLDGYLASSGVLESPRDGELRRGQSYPFSIRVPHARKVVVIDGERWHELQGEGDRFAGQVAIKGREAIIAANYPGDGGRYEYLIRYKVR